MIFPSHPKPVAGTVHSNKRLLAGFLFVVFVALLGSGIVLYGSKSSQSAGLAMAVVGILGIAALGTTLKLMQYGILARNRRERHGEWYMQRQMVAEGGRHQEQEPSSAQV